MFHLVQSVEVVPVCVCGCVCVHAIEGLCVYVCMCWNLVILLNAWIGCQPGQCEVTISCNTVGEGAAYQISHR